MDKNFIQLLLKKLRVWNRRSIHLNANTKWKNWRPVAGKVSLSEINNILPWFKENFLHNLTSKKSFSVTIKLGKKPWKNDDNMSLEEIGDNSTDNKKDKSESLKFIKQQGDLVKQLNYIISNEYDEFQEHGVKSFSIGYPLLCKKIRNEVGEEKPILSPLFIWRLELSKNNSSKDTFDIKRNEEEFLGINDMLAWYLAYNEWFEIPLLSEENLDDWIIDQTEIETYIKDLLSRLGNNTPVQSFDSEIPTDPAEYLKELWKSETIIWNGVFGLFRSSKEQIIKDIEAIPVTGLDEKIWDDSFEYEHSFGGVTTDPSQQLILEQIGESEGVIIQWPPGTGKSHTITAIIANALDNDKKCMIVCEKRTALDVIKNNLTALWLDKFCVVIEDVHSSRKDVVDYVRKLCDEGVEWSYFTSNLNYSQLLGKVKNGIKEIKKSDELQKKKIFWDFNWQKSIGLYLRSAKQVQNDSQFDGISEVLDQIDDNFTYENFIETKNIIGQGVDLYKPWMVDSALSKFKKTLFEWNYLQTKKSVEENTDNIRSTLNLLIQYNKEIYKAFETTIDSTKWLVKNIEDFVLYINQLEQYSELVSNVTWKVSTSNSISELNTWVKKLEKLLWSFLASAENNTDYDLWEIEDVSSGIDKSLENIKAKYTLAKEDHDSRISRIQNILKEIQSVSDFIDENISKNGKYYDQITLSNTLNIHLKWIFLKTYKQIILDKEETEKRIRDLGIKMANDGFQFGIEKLTGINSNNDRNVYLKKITFDLLNLLKENPEEYDVTNLNINLKLSDILGIYNSVIEKIETLDTYLKDFGVAIKRWSISFAWVEQISDKIDKKIVEITDLMPMLSSYVSWNKFYSELPTKNKKIVNALLEIENPEKWLLYYEVWFIKSVIESEYSDDIVADQQKITKLKLLLKDLNTEQILNIKKKWFQRQSHHLQNPAQLKSLYNKRWSPGERRNSLRKIIKTDFDQFTDFFPIVLVSPSVCASIMPAKEWIFDLVLFDEASQLRIEETAWAFIRWKQKIVCGDAQQMPPSSFFATSDLYLEGSNDDENEENDEDDTVYNNTDRTLSLAYSESLLDFSEKKWFRPHMLKIHYRSEHPHLIDFSNHAFYNGKLHAVPEKFKHKPIRFYEVWGVFDKGENDNEALKVIEILREILDDKYMKTYFDGKLPSIGIATFNMYQKKLIGELINGIKTTEPDSDFVQKLLRYDDTTWFIKNLDTIQWDERDVIIISTTFWKKADGKFIQNYGPINQEKGYRFLNVMITRAKKQIHLVTSIPDAHSNVTGNLVGYSNYEAQIKAYGWQSKSWAWLLHAYITYCKAVENNDEDLRQHVLRIVWWGHGGNNLGFVEGWLESPFEEEVASYLGDFVEPTRIKLQHKLGWFRVDIVLISKKTQEPLIAIECDGATYHSSDLAYANDIFRQSILESYWLKFHRIYSTNWFNDLNSEVERLKDFLIQEWEI